MRNVLLTKAILDLFARYGRQENNPDPLIIAKYFTPDSNWTWYATEFYPDTGQFFGLTIGFEKEWGYFNLSDFENVRGPMGLKVERDIYFNPAYLSESGLK